MLFEYTNFTMNSINVLIEQQMNISLMGTTDAQRLPRTQVELDHPTLKVIFIIQKNEQ